MQNQYNSNNSNTSKIEFYEGCINLILGPMFSGKSTELLRNIRRFNFKKMSTVVVAFELDNRYSEQERVVTHDKFEYPAIKCRTIYSIMDRLKDYEVIGIDEGQFYPDLVEACEELAKLGKVVFISALSGNFKREAFDVIARIIPKCESIQHILAICYNCKNDANYTLRLSLEEDEIVIGGDNMYKPACRKCFMNYQKSQSEDAKAITPVKRVSDQSARTECDTESSDKDNLTTCDSQVQTTVCSEFTAETPSKCN